MPREDVDSKEQAIARESSLICRENKKLRERNAELEALETDRVAGLQAELRARPTQQQLDEAKAAAEAAVAALEEAACRTTAADDATKVLRAELELARAAEAEVRALILSEAKEAAARERGLEREIDVLRKRAEAAETAIKGTSTHQAHLDRLEASLADARRDAEARKAEAQANEAARLAVEAELATLREAASQRGGDEHALRAAGGGLRAQLADLTSRLQAASEAERLAGGRLKSAQDDAAEARRLYAQLEEQRATERRKHKAEVERLQAELKEAKRVDREFREMIAKQIAALNEALDSREDSDARQQQLAEQLKKARKEASEQRTRADEAQANLRQERDTSAELRGRIEELEMEMTRLRAELSALLQPQAQSSSAKEPPQPTGFGTFVSLRREVASLKEQLACQIPSVLTTAASLAAGHNPAASCAAAAAGMRADPVRRPSMGSSVKPVPVRSVQAVAASRAAAIGVLQGSQSAR